MFYAKYQNAGKLQTLQLLGLRGRLDESLYNKAASGRRTPKSRHLGLKNASSEKWQTANVRLSELT
jgi:hypothetical protein